MVAGPSCWIRLLEIFERALGFLLLVLGVELTSGTGTGR